MILQEYYYYYMKTINHQQFVSSYKQNKITVGINKSMAGGFVLSDFADKHNKPAHYFWKYTGLIITLVLPIVLFFYSWIVSLASFACGISIIVASKKADEQFVLENMVRNEDFFEYVLLHGGAKIYNEKSEEIKSEFLTKMQ